MKNIGVTCIRDVTVRGSYKSDPTIYHRDSRRTKPGQMGKCSPTIIDMTLMLYIVLDKISFCAFRWIMRIRVLGRPFSVESSD